MELGRRLLMALELAGAALFCVGLAFSTARRRLFIMGTKPRKELSQKLALILGSEDPLTSELYQGLRHLGCRVLLAGPRSSAHPCSRTPAALKDLAYSVSEELGEIDLLIHVPAHRQSHNKSALDVLADQVQEDLMEHLHVVSQFVPPLAARSGHFISVEPVPQPAGAFTVAAQALTDLTDTLTKQIAGDGSGSQSLTVTRAVRRRGGTAAILKAPRDVQAEAEAILNAVQTGRSSVTLPTTKQILKHSFWHIIEQLQKLWSENIVMSQSKLAT